MKPFVTSAPFTPEQMAAALAAAPERVGDPDCPYDPHDAAAVETFWKDAIPTQGGGVEATLAELRTAREARRRGPNKRPVKQQTAIRFDADVLAGLKATGRGWQTRVNDVMRDWLKSHPAA